MKKLLFLIMLIFILLLPSSCTKNEGEVNSELLAKSDSLYVDRVDNLGNDFIMGVDASSVISLENGGVNYYDFSGSKKDVFEILSKNGINYIRVRVWNNPFDSEGRCYGGGNCTINTALEIGKRATKYNMRLLVDFHYSDFWADPGKQTEPKAWKGKSVAEKSNLIYEYTKESLNLLKSNNVNVGMVQIGNETSGWMCGEMDWKDITTLMKFGSRAVKEVYNDALVALHFTGFENHKVFYNYAEMMKKYNVDYDVFGVSYYPFWNGTLDELSEALSYVATKYNKKVAVLETTYPYTNLDTDFNSNVASYQSGLKLDYPLTVQGQANSIRNIVNTLVNETTNAIGVFYWEGTWISAGGNTRIENERLWNEFGSGWATKYASEYDAGAKESYGGNSFDNQALFDKNGKALESLKVFNLMKNGNYIENKIDKIIDIEKAIYQNEEYVIPSRVQAIYKDNSRKIVDIIFNRIIFNSNEEMIKSNKLTNLKSGIYHIIGKKDGIEAKIKLIVKPVNLLKNPSFETKSIFPWKVDGDINLTNIESNKENSYDGVCNFHFYSKNNISFSLYQDLEGLDGKYTFSLKAMGGDFKSYEGYIYISINKNIIKKPIAITKYLEWDYKSIRFNINKNDKLRVGIHISGSGVNNGPWGMIDDALLNKVEV